MPLYCLCTSKIVCKTLNGASNATKMAQIDKGLNKICILQTKGVMGMMWVATYDQLTFWSLRCLDVTLFFQRFCKALDGVFHATKIVQIDEGLNKIFIFQMKGIIGMWVDIYDQFAFWSLRSLDVTLIIFALQKGL